MVSMGIVVSRRCRDGRASKRPDWRVGHHMSRLIAAHVRERIRIPAALQKTVFLSLSYLKMMILPRQARDKHRENSKNPFFLKPFYASPEPVLVK
jgi:hypothetical protein